MGWKYKTNAAQQHQKSKDSGNQFKPVVCQKRMYGKPCKECNQVAKLAQSDDEDDKIIVGKCRSKSTYYMNVVDMMGKKTNQILASGVSNWRDLISNLPDEDGDGIDFTDPDEAYPVLLEKKGEGRNTKYSLSIGRKSIQIPVKYLKGMHKLHEVLDIIDKDEDLIWKPAKGKNKFLVLPPWGPEANGDFFFEGFFHWNVDLLGAIEEGGDDDFGDDDEGFSEDSPGDEGYSDDFGEDNKTGDDDFGDDSNDIDDFEDTDNTGESEPDIDSMTKDELIKWCALKKIDLSNKAKGASLDKLLPYVKKKVDDVAF